MQRNAPAKGFVKERVYNKFIKKEVISRDKILVHSERVRKKETIIGQQSRKHL